MAEGFRDCAEIARIACAAKQPVERAVEAVHGAEDLVEHGDKDDDRDKMRNIGHGLHKLFVTGIPHLI